MRSDRAMLPTQPRSNEIGAQAVFGVEAPVAGFVTTVLICAWPIFFSRNLVSPILSCDRQRHTSPATRRELAPFCSCCREC